MFISRGQCSASRGTSPPCSIVQKSAGPRLDGGILDKGGVTELSVKKVQSVRGGGLSNNLQSTHLYEKHP